MRLEGIHHITAITGDAPGNVDFYTRVLGLRMVKKTVNQDDPTVYHLFYADERGSAGSDLTFFEYPGAQPGRAGRGMVHRIVWRVGSDALSFWAERLAGEDVAVDRTQSRPPGALRFRDPEGLEHELIVDASGDDPLMAEHPEVPAEHSLRGFDGVRAYAEDPEASRSLLERGLEFKPAEDGWEARGEARGGFYAYDPPPEATGIQGAGTVHHVAWASVPEEQEEWRERVLRSGGRPTPVIDRFYFRSVYFREPSGVLFELATIGPGFAVDEPQESLGQRLSLPPDYEHLRAQIEATVTPLPPTRS
ncbi:MAG: VOC family protein [Nocardioidaceae bacterium]|nr:VOC family protein [Nocardioidaceae bacterium]